MSGHVYNGAPVRPDEVNVLDRRETALLFGGIGTLAVANLALLFGSAAVFAHHIKHPWHPRGSRR